MPNNENVTTKFKVDISDLKRNVTAANASIRQYKAELENANAGMKESEKNADSLSKMIEAQSKIVDAEKKKLDALKEELQRYEAAMEKGEGVVADLTQKHKEAAEQFGESSEEAKKFAKQLDEAVKAQERNEKKVQSLRTQIVQQDTAVKNAEMSVRDYNEQLDNLSKEEEDVGEKAKETTEGGLSAFAVALGNLAADVITSVISKLGDMITQTIEVGSTFEASMSKVQAISGATSEDMDKLNDSAKRLGESTQFTASQVGDAFSYMAMAGWKTEDMLGGIDGVLDLAAASGADLATTSDIVTDALTAFGESADEAGRLADIMAAASSNANTNVELMGETFKYVAPLAGSMGYTMEDTAVAVGLMANAGIKGTQAGTSLRAMITRLASPTKESGTAMAQLGIEIEKVNENGERELKPLGELIGELRDKFGEIQMPVEDFNSQMATLTRQREELTAAYEAGETSEEAYQKQISKLDKSEEDLMNKAYGAEGALKAQYAAMLAGKNGLSGFLALVNSSDEDFEKLTKAVNESSGAASEMADVMLNNLQGDITKLSSAFEGLQIAIFEKLDAPLRELVQTVTNDVIPLIKDVLNGVTGATERLNGHISEIFGGLIEKATEFLPKAVSMAVDLVGRFIDILVEQAPAIIDGAGLIIESLVDGLLKNAPKLITGLTSIVTKLISKLGELLPKIVTSIVAIIPDLVKALTAALPQLIDAVLTFGREIIAALPDIIAMIAEELPVIVQDIADVITEQLPVLLEGSIVLFDAIVQAIPEILPPLVEALPQLIDTVIKFLIDNGKTIAEAGITMFKALLEAVPVIVEAVVPLIPDIIDAITHTLIDNAPLLFDATLEVFEELGRAILTFADKLPDYIFRLLEPVYDNFITPLKDGMTEIWDYLSELPFIDFIVDVFSKCVETVKTAIDKVKGFFTGLWSNIKETFNGIGDFFSGVWDSIVETFKTIGTKVGDAIGKTFKTAINAVLETVENAINAVPDAINGAIDLLNEIPGVDIGSMDRISLPRLAKGGVVDRGTLAMVGENGREAILPLENNKAALKEIAELLADEITRSTATAQGIANNQPVTNNYNFTQTNNSPKALSRWDIYRQTNNQIRAFEMRGVLPKNV